jgi:hypothetical protein
LGEIALKLDFQSPNKAFAQKIRKTNAAENKMQTIFRIQIFSDAA